MVLDVKSLLSHISFPSHSTIRRSHGSNRTSRSPVIAPASKSSYDFVCRSSSADDNFDQPSAARTMSMDDIIILKLLGKGASGHVYLAKDTITGKHFALKVIRKEGRLPGVLDSLVYEQCIQSMVSELPGFVSLEASWHDENNFYLAMVRAFHVFPCVHGADISSVSPSMPVAISPLNLCDAGPSIVIALVSTWRNW
jgi:hypothetical protein